MMELIVRILGMVGIGIIGFLIGYEIGWFDKLSNKKHRLR